MDVLIAQFYLLLFVIGIQKRGWLLSGWHRALFGSRRLPGQRAGPAVLPVKVESTLQERPLASLGADTREPCLALGFKLPFDLSSFEAVRKPEYPCPNADVVMLYSPDGVFSSFSSQMEVVQQGQGLRFADGTPYLPPHLCRVEKFHAAAAHFSREEPCGIEFISDQQPVCYFRQPFPDDYRDSVVRYMGLDAKRVQSMSVYCSDKGSVTNFHYDKQCGLLHQSNGRKRVLLVHPEFRDYMRCDENEFVRRSWIVSEKKALTVPHWNVVLNPGDTLFIPKGFWHQVKSLDHQTLGVTAMWSF